MKVELSRGFNLKENQKSSFSAIEIWREREGELTKLGL